MKKIKITESQKMKIIKYSKLKDWSPHNPSKLKVTDRRQILKILNDEYKSMYKEIHGIIGKYSKQASDKIGLTKKQDIEEIFVMFNEDYQEDREESSLQSNQMGSYETILDHLKDVTRLGKKWDSSDHFRTELRKTIEHFYKGDNEDIGYDLLQDITDDQLWELFLDNRNMEEIAKELLESNQ
jgi:hypothetical protein